MAEKRVYEFGAFSIDVALNRLERDGRVIPLPPKAFDLLVLLARNTDRVMTKTELMETLWPDTFVDHANITQHVYTLRKTVGVPIKTMPRRGYRLDAVVREVVIDGKETSHQPHNSISVVVGAERKHATVLDCRIAKVAEIVEQAGPAAMQAVARDLLVIAAEEVGRYDGTISQRHVDGFVAVFGAPLVHEDDSRRAILAAAAIQQRFRESSPLFAGVRPDLRIGVSAGPVVVTRSADSTGAIEYQTMGDGATVAGLLQQLAAPGTVLISDSTRAAVESFIDTAPAEVEADGRPAFRVLGRRTAARGRADRPRRVLASFVGRQQELTLLAGLAARAREEKGQIVSIVGEPGIGKSRMLHEFARQVAGPAGMTVLQGQCLSYGSLIPYVPLVDLVRSYCGVGEGDSPETTRAAVERAVHATDIPAAAASCLLRLIGLPEGGTALDSLTPEAVKARTFDALRTLFFKASSHVPLVIAVEDIHWIDRSSEEFLTSLAERIAGAPITIVTTFRPGYRVPWMDRSYLTQITLTPLTATDGSELVDFISRERRLPESVSAAIVEKGEGNPFFLEELTRSVVERGPDSDSIPNTVQGVIMARVDRLPDSGKRLLQIASVLGRQVPLRLLSEVWAAGDYAGEIAELCRLEFLYENVGSEEPVLVFKHALTQDVVYDSLLAQSRRELHLRAVQALMELYGDRDDLAATFAYHYARTDAIDEAVYWLTRAADRAARVYANAEAILHLDLAARRLQRLPDGADRDRKMIDVALRHAHSLYFLGRFRESVEVLAPHEARLSRSGDPALTAAYAFWLAHMHSRLGDQRNARENAGRAIEAATRAGDEETLGKAHGLLALEGHWSGNTADGIAHGVEAVRLLRPYAPQRWWLGMAHFYLAMNHLIEGDFEKALAEADNADSVGKTIGDPRLQAYAGFTGGWVEATRGNHAVAVNLCRRSRDQAPDRVSRTYSSMFLAYALLEEGNHAESRSILEPIVSELESFGFPQWHGWAAALAAEAYRRDKQLDLARTTAHKARDVMTRARYWYGVGFAERIIGRIACDAGAYEESAAALSRATHTFERIGAVFEAERTRRESAG